MQCTHSKTWPKAQSAETPKYPPISIDTSVRTTEASVLSSSPGGLRVNRKSKKFAHPLIFDIGLQYRGLPLRFCLSEVGESKGLVLWPDLLPLLLTTALHGCLTRQHFDTLRPSLHMQDPTMDIPVYHLPTSLDHSLPSAFLVNHRVLPLGPLAPSVHRKEGLYHQGNKNNHRHSLQVCHTHTIISNARVLRDPSSFTGPHG